MKILIPVDGSVHANAALDFVASRSTLLGQEPAIALINVQPMISARVARAVGREEAEAYLRAQADDVLRPALDRLKRAGITRDSRACCSDDDERRAGGPTAVADRTPAPEAGGGSRNEGPGGDGVASR